MSNFGSKTDRNRLSKSIKINKICDATANIKKLIFWAAYSVPDLFNCKHKLFISTVLINANRLLTYAGNSHG